MPEFLVTTEADVVDPDDGVLSLREAVLAANRNDVGSDDLVDDVIRFAPDVRVVTLDSSLWVIAQNMRIDDDLATLTIEGDVDGDGVGDVTLDAQGRTWHISVSTPLHLRDVTLVNGFQSQEARRVAPEQPGLGAAGSIRADPIGPMPDGKAILSLERVHFDGNRAVGGTGGHGVDGAHGARGANGRDATASGPATRGGNGGDGGDGGRGTFGGDGGEAAGVIFGTGRIELSWVSFGPDNAATGGQGGDFGEGGAGGDGGDGGIGGNGFIFRFPAQPGGAGGDGGNAGAHGLPGRGGAASPLMVSEAREFGRRDGTFVFHTPIALRDLPEVEPAPAGFSFPTNFDAGSAGEGGWGGLLVGANAADGPDGRPGATHDQPQADPARFSRAGFTDPVLFSTIDEREAVEIVDAFADLRAEAGTLAEDGGLTLQAMRMGAEGEALRVLWWLEGPGASAFAPEDRTGEFVIAEDAATARSRLSGPGFDGFAEAARALTVVADYAVEGDPDAVVAGMGGPVALTLEDGDGRGGQTVRGTGRDDHLDGGLGADKVVGRAGDDRLEGGRGRDSLAGKRGDDDLAGEGGRDRLVGHGGDDDLSGGGGRDLLIGRKGADVLEGGGGRDSLDGGRGRDEHRFGEDSGRDVILRWDDGRVSIAFEGGAFEDLTIRDRRGDAVVKHDGGVIVVKGAAGALHEDDFLFG